MATFKLIYATGSIGDAASSGPATVVLSTEADDLASAAAAFAAFLGNVEAPQSEVTAVIEY